MKLNTSNLKKRYLSGFIQDTTISVIDHAGLSAINFLLGLAFINFGSKSDYGVYAQLFAFLMLLQSIFVSLVNEPLLTLASKKHPISIAQMESVLLQYLVLSGLLVSLLIYLLLVFASSLSFTTVLSAKVALSFSLALFTLLVREYLRAVCFLRHAPQVSLQIDIIYAIALGFGLLFFYQIFGFGLITVFTAVAIANLIALVYGLVRLRISPIFSPDAFSHVIAETWSCSKWSLPRSVVTWLFANTYLYITGFFFGSVIVAEISAARLFIMPLGLCIAAWEKIFLPRASRWLSQHRLGKVQQTANNSSKALIALVVLYILLLVLLFDKIQLHFFANNYTTILPLVLLWGGWAFVNSVRTVATNLMIAALKFRQIFYYALVVSFFSLPITVIAAYFSGPEATLATYILSEAFLAYLTWCMGWRKVFRQLRAG